eukprot:COSAG03_NODE_2442_length_2760_cov_1919.337467_3_plen_34_part_00
MKIKAALLSAGFSVNPASRVEMSAVEKAHLAEG